MASTFERLVTFRITYTCEQPGCPNTRQFRIVCTEAERPAKTAEVLLMSEDTEGWVNGYCQDHVVP